MTDFTDLAYHSLIDENEQSVVVHRYQIPNYYYSFRHNFNIKDDLGRDVYRLKSKWSLGTKLIIEDMDGNGLIKIESELMHIHSRYRIFSARPDDLGRELAVVKQKTAFTTSRFDIESSYGQYSTDKGNKSGSAFVIKKAEKQVATINTKIFSSSAALKVEVMADEDQPFILALAIILFDFSCDSIPSITGFSHVPAT